MKMSLIVAVCALLIAGLLFILRDWRALKPIEFVGVGLQVAAVVLVFVSMHQVYKDGINVRSANLRALRWEIKENMRLFDAFLRAEREMLEGDMFPLNSFQLEVYKQGIVTHHLKDQELIQGILLFYSGLQVANKAMELSAQADLMPLTNSKEKVKKYNGVVSDMVKLNRPRAVILIERLEKTIAEL